VLKGKEGVFVHEFVTQTVTEMSTDTVAPGDVIGVVTEWC